MEDKNSNIQVVGAVLGGMYNHSCPATLNPVQVFGVYQCADDTSKMMVHYVDAASNHWIQSMEHFCGLEYMDGAWKPRYVYINGEEVA